MANKYVKSFNFGGDTLYPLPIVTTEDNGKVMKVVDGSWACADLVPAKIISFSVRGNFIKAATYQAEEGMTWFEWINSDYNIDGYIGGSDTVIKYPNNVYKLYTDTTVTTLVYGSDVIVADHIYAVYG